MIRPVEIEVVPTKQEPAAKKTVLQRQKTIGGIRLRTGSPPVNKKRAVLPDYGVPQLFSVRLFHLFGSTEAALDWWISPRPNLQGISPKQLFDEGKIDVLARVIGRIEEGMHL